MNSKKETFSVRPFEKLRKSIQRQQTPQPSAISITKKKEEFTDEELFSREMDDVREIDEFRALSCEPQRRASAAPGVRRDPNQDVLAVLGAITTGELPINLPDTQEYVAWTNPGYHDAIIAKLHEGHFSVQAFLDLHGYTVSEAETEMDAFLREAFTKSLRCVKIIYGRGLRSVKGPRIKDAVVRRLAGHYRNNIIAYTSARQCDGGLGAVYVLLAKR